MAAVHIDDLADPSFPAEVEPLLEGAAALAGSVDLSVEGLCRAATDATGLSDFGDPGFRDRLATLLLAFERDVELSPLGRVTATAQHTQLLANRLRIEDLIARHPGIEEIEIAEPIIIAGLPRTGTTHLHNLLAADPALRSLPYWESLEPVPGPADVAAVEAGEPDPRIERAAASTSFLNAVLPYLARMHEMDATHVHEEIQLLAIDYSTMFFETLAPIPTWRDAYLAADQAPHYRYLKRVLQVLQHLRPGHEPTRWVLKSPQHLEQFRALVEVFPDATVLVTHRDPVSVTASISTMISYTARLHLAEVDPAAIGHYWSDRLDTMLGACLRDRALLPADRSTHITFSEFMADDLGTIERIYELAGQDLDARARDAQAAYRASHERNRHGKLIYDLADFDLDVATLRERFADYQDGFAIAAET